MKFCADMHIHTIASTHAYSTIGEIVAHAANMGLKAVAVTDHGPAMPDAPHIWHFGNQRVLPKEYNGVRIFSGAEANIVDTDGNIDVTVAAKLDYVIAAMHHDVFKPASPSVITPAWLAACDNPDIDCLGHTGQADYVFDYEEVVKRCRETNTLIELNNASKRVRPGSWKNCAEILKLCKKHETRIIVSSDAHIHWAVGEFSAASELIEELNFPEELIVNADWDRFKEYFGIEK